MNSIPTKEELSSVGVFMFRKVYLYSIIFSALACCSCSNKQYQVLFEQKKSLAPDSSISAENLNYQYRIQSQDILEIKNLQNSKSIVDLNPVQAAGTGQGSTTTQSENYQVEEDGTVALTGLGHVKIAGLTRYEAQQKIEALYQNTYLKNPIIILKIVTLKVTILGEIKTQGSFPLIKDHTSLIELIGEAGGLTDKANERDVKIIRGSERDPQVFDIDLSNIHSINDENAILRSGDIIYIGQSKRAARNDNLQNFSVIIQPALILFNTALIIFTLVRK